MAETCGTLSITSLACTCLFLIAAGLAGLLQCRSFCKPRRIWLWALPYFFHRNQWASGDFLNICDWKIVVGIAGLFASGRVQERVPDRMSDGLSDEMLEVECEKECQKECLIKCPMECQIEAHLQRFLKAWRDWQTWRISTGGDTPITQMYCEYLFCRSDEPCGAWIPNFICKAVEKFEKIAGLSEVDRR